MALRFKLDENLSPSLAKVLVDAGHDVATAAEESPRGAPPLKPSRGSFARL